MLAVRSRNEDFLPCAKPMPTNFSPLPCGLPIGNNVSRNFHEILNVIIRFNLIKITEDSLSRHLPYMFVVRDLLLYTFISNIMLEFSFLPIPCRLFYRGYFPFDHIPGLKTFRALEEPSFLTTRSKILTFKSPLHAHVSTCNALYNNCAVVVKRTHAD